MKRTICTLLIATGLVMTHQSASAAVGAMSDYTAYPPFINQAVPPLVMLTMTKDHRMFFKGYNDLVDLDNGLPGGDANPDITYKDNIDYYGYFDSKKCYDFVGTTGASGTGRFEPQAAGTGTYLHYCTNKWSGNFLNWATMARIDIVRKTLYGGKRVVDTAGSTTATTGSNGDTTLGRAPLPRDAHSWTKVYRGADVNQLVPTTGLVFTSSPLAVTICNTNTATTETVGAMMVLDGDFPDAASTEVRQCFKTQETGGTQFALGATNTILKATYRVAVQVCKSNIGILGVSGLESNCETYKDDNGGSPTNYITYKPTGLFQRMGINTKGTPGTSDDIAAIKFGLLTGSYDRNLSGGVLRSKVADPFQEIVRANGTIAAGSKIIANIDRFRVVGYQYPDLGGGAPTGSYNAGGSEGTCSTSTPSDGTCRSWGEPLAEMFYESIRYFRNLAGTGNATTQYYSASPDNGLLGLTAETNSAYGDPYDPATCPYCAKPFVLLLGHSFPSHDSDQLPGAFAWTTAPGAVTPTPNDTTLTMSNLITASGMNGLEGVASSIMIGEIGGATDKQCSFKTGTTFYNLRGLCVEEPTRFGSYYLPALAHYAKTTDLRSDLTADVGNKVKQTITTYAVVTSAPVPILEFTIGGKKVQLASIFHDGCPKVDPVGGPYYYGAHRGGLDPRDCQTAGQGGDNTKGSLVDFQFCQNDADWTTEQGNGYTSCYEIMWDDGEYGNDFDLDIRYRLYVKDNGSTTITVKAKEKYANSGHTNFSGYYINGISGQNGNGEYYEIRCGGSGFPNISANTDCDTYDGNNGTGMTERTFTVVGSPAGLLKDPMWYATKYGGFEDRNNSVTPDQVSEWDANSDGDPDTYFKAQNPLQLESKLAAAFASILNRASSGTAASVLASSTTGEGALYQSFFFASRTDATLGKDVKWVGYTQGLFVDTFGNLHEDSDGNGKLTCTGDKIVIMRYNSATTTTVADLYTSNSNCQATGAAVDIDVPLEELKTIWESGRRLALTTPGASCGTLILSTGGTCRRILTYVDTNNDKIVDPTFDNEVIEFKSSGTNVTKLTPFLNADASGPYTAANIIDFIRGNQVSGMRDRQLTIKNDAGVNVTAVWKMGDPVYATPVVVGRPKERYDVLYGDTGYAKFYAKYRDRRQVAYVGANDGMLHAVNVGFYHPGNGTHHGCFTVATTDTCASQVASDLLALGRERWAFIPQELLPQLRWLADPAYSHVYYVDLKPKVTEARLFLGDGQNCDTCKHPGGWGTILIGGFRFGGSCGTCPAGPSNGAAMTINADFDGSGPRSSEDRSFYSAYFVLDISDPEADPTVLWTFSDAQLGFTTSYPSIMRVLPSTTTDKTDAADSAAKWFVLFGSGATNYGGTSNQRAQLFLVNLKSGPMGDVASPVRKFDADEFDATPGPAVNGFVGDLTTVDRNLDFRVDVAYGGEMLQTSSYTGTLFRLTTQCSTGGSLCPTDPTQWGIVSAAANTRMTTRVVYKFPCGTATKPCVAGPTVNALGPVTSAPSVAADDANNLWVFLGSGRYYSVGAGLDSTNRDQQYLVGAKDQLLSNNCAAGETGSDNCSSVDLVDVSLAEICVLGYGNCGSAAKTQVTGVTGLAATGSFSDMVNLVNSKEGWFYKLQIPTSPAPSERQVGAPVALGGLVFFPTFLPSTDTCIAAGTSNLYALYYVTGTAYTDPVLGYTADGAGNRISGKSTSLGEGLATTVSIHIGAQGNGTTGGGSQSGMIACSQSSTGAVNCVNFKQAISSASRYVTWNHNRD